ncbi:uncharacterized protein LOC131631944 [Vicia villosa]|uniref:uncharacterized protein LOC131631944 n=1 Tax=Vicia villosa TaxID=3911 RepID=UPI00273A9CEB|nr:uncharacterized protein LOC131631944 [Vicia villosa]
MSIRLISYNIRGLGGLAKKKEVQNLIGRQRPTFICIQETKLENIDRNLCLFIWGSNDFDFAFKPSNGRSGGILAIWDKNFLSIRITHVLEYALWLEGEWGMGRNVVSLVTVYAPCDRRSKSALWSDLLNRINRNREVSICILGDFNAIRDISERKGGNETYNMNEIEEFDNFISDAELIDIPILGRSFTWQRPGGSVMSRLDRFLLSEKWNRTWPSCTQWCLDKGLSDHCPIMLCESSLDWGPKPFRMLKCWREMRGYHDFVIKNWRDIKVQGWGMYVLKEKFKKIKVRLKEWHKNHFQNLEGRIKEEKEKLNGLEVLGESTGYSVEDLQARSEISSTIHKLSNLNCSIQWQKARSKWLKEGDANSKYFHSCINKRRKDNEILCLDVNGRRVTEVKDIKEEIFDHFSRQFASRGTYAIPENLISNYIDDVQNVELVREFSEEEIRRAVWECDNDKSPGPDGVNFGFVK